ncbi:hypothetical protein [Brevibacillus daliensis]|uniref:hypothetical protein n=1 Tax=Brevibacillus daliensis TaxID=2892995 RepID=UPI001E3098C6|nr:hypothetical protein [Brevibacillus daliensis]
MDLTYDIATLAAIVAALTGVAKGFGVPSKYAPLVAILLSGVFVFIPDGAIRDNLLTTVIVGLTAAGAYSYVKPGNDEMKTK